MRALRGAFAGLAVMAMLASGSAATAADGITFGCERHEQLRAHGDHHADGRARDLRSQMT